MDFIVIRSGCVSRDFRSSVWGDSFLASYRDFDRGLEFLPAIFLPFQEAEERDQISITQA